MKIDGRTLTHQASAAIRRMAVRRVQEGEQPSAVIRAYGLCRTSIYKWLRAALCCWPMMRTQMWRFSWAAQSTLTWIRQPQQEQVAVNRWHPVASCAEAHMTERTGADSDLVARGSTGCRSYLR